MNTIEALNETIRRQRSAIIESLGPTVMQALNDDAVVEVMLNPDGRLYAERFGHWPEVVGEMKPSQASLFLGQLATIHRTAISLDNPLLRCHLPLEDFCTLGVYPRVQGFYPPISTAPAFNIRKHSKDVPTLQQYIDEGRITAKQVEVINETIRNRGNIWIGGGTSTGKTHLAKAIFDAIRIAAPYERFVIVEDTPELTSHPCNKLTICSTSPDPSKPHVGMQSMVDLIAAAKRARPDRLFVGENRYGEDVEALLMAWRSGHDGGFCTGHVGSVQGCFVAIEQMLRKSKIHVDREELASTIHLIVFITKDETSFRYVAEVAKVKGYHPEKGYLFESFYHTRGLKQCVNM